MAPTVTVAGPGRGGHSLQDLAAAREERHVRGWGPAAAGRRGTDQQWLGGARLGWGGQRRGVSEDTELSRSAGSECQSGGRLAQDWWFPEVPEGFEADESDDLRDLAHQRSPGTQRQTWVLIVPLTVHIHNSFTYVIIRHSSDCEPDLPGASRGTESWSGLKGH